MNEILEINVLSCSLITRFSEITCRCNSNPLHGVKSAEQLQVTNGMEEPILKDYQ